MPEADAAGAEPAELTATDDEEVDVVGAVDFDDELHEASTSDRAAVPAAMAKRFIPVATRGALRRFTRTQDRIRYGLCLHGMRGSPIITEGHLVANPCQPTTTEQSAVACGGQGSEYDTSGSIEQAR